MKIDEIAYPGMMISQAWPKSRETEFGTLRALDSVLELGGIRYVQTVEIPSSRERREIAHLLSSEKMKLTYALTRVMNDHHLNLSSLDEDLRTRSVQHLARCLWEAKEAGAESVALISGPAPDNEDDRKRALDQLGKSILEMAVEARCNGDMRIVIEPLDVWAHKKNTLGKTIEGVQLCENLADHGEKVSLCFDTAHVNLNGEVIFDSLDHAINSVAELHLCNCVMDSSHSLFGDRHIRFGKPGIVGIEEIVGLLVFVHGIMRKQRIPAIPVFCEVLKQEHEDSVELAGYCRDILAQAWEEAEFILSSQTGG